MHAMSPSDEEKDHENVVAAGQEASITAESDEEPPVDDSTKDPPTVNDDDDASADDADNDKEEEEEEENVNEENSESNEKDGGQGGQEEGEVIDDDSENQDDDDEEEVQEKEPSATLDTSDKEDGEEPEEEYGEKNHVESSSSSSFKKVDKPADEEEEEDDAAHGNSQDTQGDASAGDDMQQEGEEEEDAELSEKEKDDDASSASSSSSGSSSNSSSDEDSSSDDDEGCTSGVARKSTTDDGRQLSEYEQLRLDRIERNRQYLAKLGLEGNSNNGGGGGGFLGSQQNNNNNQETKQRRRKKKPVVLPPRRSTLDRSSKGKIVRYALTIPPVRELLKGNFGPNDTDQERNSNNNNDNNNQEDDDRKPAAIRRPGEASASSALSVTGRPKSHAQRMDLVIHREFLRIRTEKRNVLRQAQKNVRAAEKEVAYWGKRAAAVERAEQRQLQEKSRVERIRLAREKERQELGGFTCKELVQQYDGQLSEILTATGKYDEVFLVAAREKERLARQVEMEKKMQTIGALERFPKAMRDALSVLNSVLLERAPKDPPPPRRSKRAADEVFESSSSTTTTAADGVVVDAPISPKRKKAKKSDSKNASSSKSESPSSDDLPAVPVQLAEEAEEEEDVVSPANNKKKNTATTSSSDTQQGRRPKRVGGWVQPDFAATIQRAWLNKDATTADTTAFCLAEYVPQVGDAILYYPIAHAAFLQEYPDVLGKKTRNLTRLPLWERAVSERKKSGEDDDDKNQSSASPSTTKWWTDEWIMGIKEDKGKCPILCIVQGTCAEFPPDMKANGTKNPGDKDTASQRGSNSSGKKGPQLRLSVTLRPLTPVVPGSECPDLRLAPVFNVVTFPSRLRPFLVPFSWAYTFNHSLSVGQAVHDKSKPKSQLRIGAFDAMANRLEDNICAIESIRKKFGEKGLARKFSLINALSEDSRSSMPVGDALAVLETFDSFSEGRKEEPSQSDALDANIDLLALIGSTLPIWDSVTIVTGARDRTVSVVSPWEVQTACKVDHVANASPDKLVHLSSSFDESLRLKIECALEDQLKQLGDSAGLFTDPITDDDAPNYSCAVPVTMCFSKIFKRLKPKSKGRRSCYYRSVGSVMSDITAIQDNCLLYNNPDAEVVDAVMDVVSTVKDAISQVVRDHNKELCATRKADEERQRLVMLHCATGSTSASDPTRNSSMSKTVVVCRVKELYKQQLEQNWLQEVLPAATGTSKNSTSTEKMGAWIPQAGDRVLYCRELHTDFVRGHYPSLELEQCYMPPATEPATEMDGEAQQPREAAWRRGAIVWTRATFPKILSKKSDEDAHTFATTSTLLALGVRFEAESKDLQVIYWRPCLFCTSDSNKGKICSACGIPSFLRPDSVGKENGDDTDEGQETTGPTSMSQTESDSIDRCFSFLKRRCLAEVSPSYVDSKLTKANVKQGYLPPHTKIGLKSLPSFEDAFTANASGTGHGTRKSNSRAKIIDPLLVQCGFVPSWLSEPDPSNSTKGPRFHETVSPWPKLCLELIQLRLKNGFYRHRAAVENDIIEAFASIAFLLLAEPAGRKNPHLSIKRIARLLSFGKSKVNISSAEDGNKEQAATQDDAAALKNEEEWASRLRPIRELYATALVCVSDTKTFECLCGIAPLTPPINLAPPNPLICVPQQDPIQVEARKKLALLQAALGRDELLNTFGSINAGYAPVPQAKLKIFCGGKVVSHQKLAVTTTKTVIAVMNGKSVRTKVFLGGREFSVNQEELNGEEVDLKTVVAGTVLQSSGPGCTRRVESVVEDSICFSLDQLERSEALAKIFFGRPGRMNSCARCHANMRSMVVCRVLKSHSNTDLDWTSTMRGVGGINGLLKGLNPEHNSQVEVAVIADEAMDSTAGNLEVVENEASEVADDDDAKDAVDPKEAADKAQKALSLAREVLVDAQAFYNAPERMSKEFVESDVPVDPSDGKKVYCIVCGLSGDLLCCDGCSNVVHQGCVELKDVPEGDWFCEECVRRRSVTAEEQEEEKKDEREKEEQTKDLPFGRVVFDLERLEGLTSTLQDLRDLHTNRKKRKRDDDGEASDDENELSDPFMVLSAMTRRFLASIGIRSAEELVSSGTTAVGEEFVKWRKEEGMAELKGSGRVASVSMWKRAVKDTAVEMGITLSEEMAPELGNGDVDSDDQESEKKSRPSVTIPRKRKSHVVDVTSDFDVDDALAVLSETTKSFLCSEGITTCEQFLSTRTSDLGDLFGVWREQQGLPQLKANGNGASVSAWKAACRKAGIELGWEVQAIENGVTRRVVEKEANSHSRRKGQPTPVSKASPPSTKSQSAKRAANTPDKRKKAPENVCSPRSIRAKRRLNEDGENIEGRQDMESPRLKRAARRPRTTQSTDPEDFVAVVGDPIGVLDEMPLRFLRSIGVETAESFLSLITSDVARKYGPWRQKQGLPTLKGSGDGAHVSAWKSRCRKACKSRGRKSLSSENVAEKDTASSSRNDLPIDDDGEALSLDEVMQSGADEAVKAEQSTLEQCCNDSHCPSDSMEEEAPEGPFDIEDNSGMSRARRPPVRFADIEEYKPAPSISGRR